MRLCTYICLHFDVIPLMFAYLLCHDTYTISYFFNVFIFLYIVYSQQLHCVQLTLYSVQLTLYLCTVNTISVQGQQLHCVQFVVKTTLNQIHVQNVTGTCTSCTQLCKPSIQATSLSTDNCQTSLNVCVYGVTIRTTITR